MGANNSNKLRITICLQNHCSFPTMFSNHVNEQKVKYTWIQELEYLVVRARLSLCQKLNVIAAILSSGWEVTSASACTIKSASSEPDPPATLSNFTNGKCGCILQARMKTQEGILKDFCVGTTGNQINIWLSHFCKQVGHALCYFFILPHNMMLNNKVLKPVFGSSKMPQIRMWKAYCI